MRVKYLIEKLQKLDENLEIGYYDFSRDEVSDIIDIKKVCGNEEFEKDFKSDLYII